MFPARDGAPPVKTISADDVAAALMLHKATPSVAVAMWWRAWKASHDRADAKHSCCRTTQELFNALDALEENMVGLLKAKNDPG